HRGGAARVLPRQDRLVQDSKDGALRQRGAAHAEPPRRQGAAWQASRAGAEGDGTMTLHTALCDLLGIEHPIVQSGMGGVAGPDLVAEVSKAGGLGVIAALNLTADQVREAIRRVRAATDRPFGVNQFMPDSLRPPADPVSIPERTVAEVQSTLNGFRTRLGLPTTTARPPAVPDLIDAAFEVIVEERVPVWSIGLGQPSPEQIRRAHARGIRVMAMVTTVEDA